MKTTRMLLMLVLLLALPTMFIAAQDAEELQMGFWEECETPENLPETVTIGAVFGLSGPISVYGGVQQQGVQLAIEEINESGYLGEGVTLEVIFEDAPTESGEQPAINA